MKGKQKNKTKTYALQFLFLKTINLDGSRSQNQIQNAKFLFHTIITKAKEFFLNTCAIIVFVWLQEKGPQRYLIGKWWIG